MPPPFTAMTLDGLRAALAAFPWQRRIQEVHMHHTWKPDHATWRAMAAKGRAAAIVEGMWRYHTQNLGWADIAQHVSIAPDGAIWSGRDWNRPPASEVGYNGTAAAGPFMFETIGNFDRGGDPFAGAQRDAVLGTIAAVLGQFGLPPEKLRFHNQLKKPGAPPPKTCPGSAIAYDDVLAELRARMATAPVAAKKD